MAKKENKVGFDLILSIIGLSFLFLSIVIIRTSMPIYRNELYMVIQTVFLLSIVYYFQLWIHELGHFLFGKITNYNLILFRIASFVLVNNQNGLELKRYSSQGAGGQCLMAPPDSLEGKFPFILYNLGGVILNLLISLISFSLYRGINGRSLIKASLIGISLFGFYLAILNGLPMKLGSGSNDGYNIILLIRDSLFRTAYYNQLKINKQLVDGYRFRDIESTYFITELDEENYNHLTLSIYLLNIKRLMDAGLYEEARLEIRELLDNSIELGEVQVAVLEGELLYMDMIGPYDKTYIKSKYQDKIEYYKKIAVNNISMNRIIYGYELLVDQNISLAKKYRERLENIFKTYPFMGEAIMEKDLLDRVDDVYREELGELYS